MTAMFLEILRHLFEKAEKELAKFSRKTGWKTSLMVYLSKDGEDNFVATRDQSGLLHVVSEEEFFEEEEEESVRIDPPREH